MKRELAKLCNLPRVVAVTGALGSGKTEWIMDFAEALGASGRSVVLADMDIINPYFCLRSIPDMLAGANLKLLTPPGDFAWGDLTYLNPAIRAALYDETSTTVLDVGGDSQGGLALKQFELDIEKVGYSLHFVVNPFRTHTRTIDEIRTMVTRLESTSGLEVSGVVANPHLGPETKPEDCARGILLTREFAGQIDKPLFYALAEEGIAESVSRLLPDDIPLWPLRRRVLAPWERRTVRV